MPSGFREHYIRDAQGHALSEAEGMAIYKYTNSGTASTKVVERPVYGSSRLGSYALAQEVMVSSLVDYPFTQLLSDVHKRYELNDHLGNVNTVVSGRLLDGAGAGSPKQAEVLTAQGYEPFGALLPGRNWRQPIGTPPPPVTAKGTLVITEFSNGPSGSCEYVEIYVTKCALYPDATEVDIRGWIIDDNAGNFNTSGLCGTGVAINSGHLRFADVPAWASVPVGTVIVLFNGPDPADNCYGFTVDESGTGPYFIDVNSTSLLQRTGTGGTPSSTDCGYCDNSYTTATWDPVSLGNTADAVQVRCPDCPESEAGFFHGVAYGSGFGGLVAGANDLGGAYVPGPGGGRSYELTGTGSPGDGAQWTRITAPAGGTPPTTAGVVDAGVVAGLESASLACCGSFEAPVLAQKQGYRFAFQGQEKDDEIHGATGTSYAYTYRMHDARVGRFWSIDPLASKYPHNSPYAFSENRVIDGVELEGLEVVLIGQRTSASVFLGGSVEYGIAVGPNGTYMYTSTAIGLSTSTSVSATLSLTYYPTMPRVQYAAGWGGSLGVSGGEGVVGGGAAVYSQGYGGYNFTYGVGGSVGLLGFWTVEGGASHTILAPLSDLAKLEGGMDILHNVKDRLKEDISGLQQDAKKLQGGVTQLEAKKRLSESDNDRNKYQKEIDSMRGKIGELDTEISTKQKALDDVNSALQENYNDSRRK